jgi:hypothetical protein
MTILNPTSYGDNQQVPSASAETFIPDQLIAGGGAGLVSDTVIFVGGADLKRGTLVGLQAGVAPGAAVAAGQGAGGANTGNGTISAISVSADVSAGLYLLTFTGATAFTLTDPFGNVVAAPAALGAFTSNQINFTSAAGGTAFVAGDGFSFTVTGGAFILSLPGATDGSQVPAGVTADYVPLSVTTPQQGGIYLQGEFNANYMTFGAGWDPASAKVALQKAGKPIYLKDVGALDSTNIDPTL